MAHSLLLALVLACTGGSSVGVVETEGDPEEAQADEDGPSIDHEPIETAQPLGEDVEIIATVSDGDDGTGVFAVEVYYKDETSTTWSNGRALVTTDGETYTGTIPGTSVVGGGMNYYLAAYDKADNRSYMPDEGEDDPYHFRINGG